MLICSAKDIDKNRKKRNNALRLPWGCALNIGNGKAYYWTDDCRGKNLPIRRRLYSPPKSSPGIMPTPELIERLFKA